MEGEGLEEAVAIEQSVEDATLSQSLFSIVKSFGKSVTKPKTPRNNRYMNQSRDKNQKVQKSQDMHVHQQKLFNNFQE